MTDNNYPYKPYTEPAHTQSTVTVSAGTKDKALSMAPCIVSLATGVSGFFCGFFTLLFELNLLNIKAYYSETMTHQSEAMRGIVSSVGSFIGLILVLCFYAITLIMAVLGLVFGIIGSKGQRRMRPMAIAGLIISVITLIFLLGLAVLLVMNAASGAFALRY